MHRIDGSTYELVAKRHMAITQAGIDEVGLEVSVSGRRA